MSADAQGELDVTLEQELAAADNAPAPTPPAKPRKSRAKPKPPAADNLAELGDARVATAGVPVEVLSYSRSPGMELNSTAARALNAVGGKGDLLVIAVEPGHLATITRLAHRAFGLTETDPAD